MTSAEYVVGVTALVPPNERNRLEDGDVKFVLATFMRRVWSDERTSTALRLRLRPNYAQWREDDQDRWEQSRTPQ